jgi:uncharacterized membrane protein
MFSDSDLEFFRKHRLKILLALAFMVLGILFSTIGFLKTIFVLFLVIIGIFVGKFIDDPESVRKILDKYFSR